MPVSGGAIIVPRAAPGVDAADDRDPLRIRRPDGEADAGNAVDGREVGPEGIGELVVMPLAEQMQVEIAQQGPEGISVLDDLLAAGPGDHQTIGAGLEIAGEKPLGLHRPQDHIRPIRLPDGDREGARHEHPQIAPARALMRAEHGEGVAESPCGERGARGHVQGRNTVDRGIHHAVSLPGSSRASSCVNPSSGTASQSGLLLTS